MHYYEKMFVAMCQEHELMKIKPEYINEFNILVELRKHANFTSQHTLSDYIIFIEICNKCFANTQLS